MPVLPLPGCSMGKLLAPKHLQGCLGHCLGKAMLQCLAVVNPSITAVQLAEEQPLLCLQDPLICLYLLAMAMRSVPCPFGREKGRSRTGWVLASHLIPLLIGGSLHKPLHAGLWGARHTFQKGAVVLHAIQHLLFNVLQVIHWGRDRSVYMVKAKPSHSTPHHLPRCPPWLQCPPGTDLPESPSFPWGTVGQGNRGSGHLGTAQPLTSQVLVQALVHRAGVVDVAALARGLVAGAGGAIPGTVRVPGQAALGTGSAIALALVQPHLGHPQAGTHIKLLLEDGTIWQ